MNRKNVALLTAGVLLALAGTAQAATRTSTFNVTATVNTNCVITTPDLAFGTFDGLVDTSATSIITVRCSNGTPFFVDLNGGSSGDVANRTMTSVSSAVPLRYNLYTDAAHNQLWGNGQNGTGRASGTGGGMGTARTFTVYGLLDADLNTGEVDAGSYADIITATVNY
jgi:spore coat protein U-like protein